MDPRKLMIALNASERIERGALCRLAALSESWQSLTSDADLDRRAADLEVPTQQLRRALEVCESATDAARREIRRAERFGCRILTRLDSDYPTGLFDLALPPPVLTCRGTLPTRPAVAIVGSRRMDDYGRQAARWFAKELAAAGVTVISGFARGIDTTAHRAALAAGGTTVAVLGCGIDIDYPKGNAELGVDIVRSGAILSEFPMGAEPRAWRFPIRNRVIAALAVGTLVVEATFKSGSLITAHQALELGRDIYAVPGRIFDESSAGTNALIADGATPARSPRDILESLSLGVQQELFPTPLPRTAGTSTAGTSTAGTSTAGTRPTTTPAADVIPSPSPSAPACAPPKGTAGRVFEILDTNRGLPVEEIASGVQLPIEEVLGILLELELAGIARRAPGPVYLR